MRDINVDWCFEGGCTHIGDESDMLTEELDIAELEAMYSEPCIAMAD